jgi:NAD-dependent dihydropyrimidine dehydrogenase PreA subunit
MKCMENIWFGIPIKKIDWFPTIDYNKCIGCMACVRKCKHGVYAEKDGKPRVVNPKNCVVGCTGCEPVCPQGAISHPPKSYLRQLKKRDDFRSECRCGSC